MFGCLQDIEEQREKERNAMLNAELSRRLKTRTYEEAEKAFLEGLAFKHIDEKAR